MKQEKFLRNAAVVSVGGFIAKAAGALYRIPLTAFIGAEGLGMYQLVYPFYCLLLTVSASGIPSGLAKIIAAEDNKSDGDGYGAFLKCLRIYFLVGLVSSVLMFTLAKVPSLWQGKDLSLAYRMLAPAILPVSILSCFRGWYQGKNNMLPTAASEIAEQGVKIAFGILFTWLFRDNLVKAVAFAMLAVTVAEVCALVGMILYFRRKHCLSLLKKSDYPAKNIFRYTVPLALTAAILPLASFIDSLLIVEFLKDKCATPIARYGIYSGGAQTVINLIVSVCYGFAVSAVPAVSAAFARKEYASAFHNVQKAFLYTLAVAIPAAIAVYFASGFLVRLIFYKMNEEELALLTELVKIMSVSAVSFSALQTLSSCLTGLGKPFVSTLSVLLSVGVRIVTECILLSLEKINIHGAAVAYNLGFLVAFLFDLLYIIVYRKKVMQRKETL